MVHPALAEEIPIQGESQLAIEAFRWISSHRSPVLGFGVVLYPPLPASYQDQWFREHGIGLGRLRTRLDHLIGIIDEEWQSASRPSS